MRRRAVTIATIWRCNVHVVKRENSATVKRVGMTAWSTAAHLARARLFMVGVLAACASVPPAVASARTYVADCGNLTLREKPAKWDVGCTGGSPAASELTWTGWGTATATAPGKVRRRYDTTGNFEDRIYPLFDGRVTLTKVRRFACAGRPRQYTQALIEWTVPPGFPYDQPGPQSVTFKIGKRCPTYVLGENNNGAFVGIGIARPARISSAAGSESFFGLKWRRWGSKQTTARGRFASGAGASSPVTLTAFGRGTDSNCDSPRAYSRMRIKFRGYPSQVVALCQ